MTQFETELCMNCNEGRKFGIVGDQCVHYQICLDENSDLDDYDDSFSVNNFEEDLFEEDLDNDNDVREEDGFDEAETEDSDVQEYLLDFDYYDEDGLTKWRK